ncbi:MAG: 4-(cytidine 5'-diphospho)-2-C-methyl-D-erythritol kinase [bacterium]|nr:4-(cytidine 5'-diphospho)-2-C-methyl-D-erythritol kinase [bacterium]
MNPQHSPYPDIEDLGRGGFAIYAPAKINVGLHVLGKRPDGYHEIETVFQEISWADRIEFYPARDWTLEIHGLDLDPGPENLVNRAAQELSREAGVPCRGRVVLSKEIPLGAGLGGGSSDAAITLLGLSRLWGIGWGVTRLCELAARVGSDCSFFLYGGMAKGRGRGEVIEPGHGCLDGEIVLVVPPFGVRTAWAYEAGGFPLTRDEESVIFPSCHERGGSSQFDRDLFSNDLENIVLKKYSELSDIKASLLRLGAQWASLSGSGSTVFGVFPERSRAMHAAQQFGSPLKVRVCRAVGRLRES